MLKKLLFADLDDTLFQSRRKCPEDARLEAAAYLRDGTAHSFQTHGQQSLLRLFMDAMQVIPVTARNVDAYQRVRLGFRAEAIVNYGGLILDDAGTPDPAWLERSRQHAAASQPMFETVVDALAGFAAQAGLAIRAKVIADFGVPFYVSVKSEEGDVGAESALDQVAAFTEDLVQRFDALSHRNGNNLALVPRWLDKRHAVEHLADHYRARYGEIITIGMGDSLSDLGFMTGCDYALVPRRSQIGGQLGSHSTGAH